MWELSAGSCTELGKLFLSTLSSATGVQRNNFTWVSCNLRVNFALPEPSESLLNSSEVWYPLKQLLQFTTHIVSNSHPARLAAMRNVVPSNTLWRACWTELRGKERFKSYKGQNSSKRCMRRNSSFSQLELTLKNATVWEDSVSAGQTSREKLVSFTEHGVNERQPEPTVQLFSCYFPGSFWALPGFCSTLQCQERPHRE